MNLIELGRLKELLTLEESTGKLFWNQGTSIRARGEAGYINVSGYRLVMIDGKNHRAHRLVWLLTHGQLPPEDVDHINGLRADNRAENLRLASRSENNQNQKRPRSGSKSPYLGVTWHAQANRWIAQITVNKKHKYLGLYKTPEEAHEAYVFAKRQLHTHGTL